MKSSKSLDNPLNFRDDLSMDILITKIKSIKVTDNIEAFIVKVSFCDQLMINSEIKTIDRRDDEKNAILEVGALHYDPSDYEKMCLYANTPLIGI